MATDMSYDEYKAITDQYYTNGQMPAAQVFIDLLARNGIGLRRDDGNFHEATFSVPQTEEGLVLGMRYEKRDGTHSEDLFLFRPGKPILPGYKGGLEKIFPEYRDTHKGKPNT